MALENKQKLLLKSSRPRKCHPRAHFIQHHTLQLLHRDEGTKLRMNDSPYDEDTTEERLRGV